MSMAWGGDGPPMTSPSSSPHPQLHKDVLLNTSTHSNNNTNTNINSTNTQSQQQQPSATQHTSSSSSSSSTSRVLECSSSSSTASRVQAARQIFHCQACDLSCTSDPAFQNHLRGKAHAKRVGSQASRAAQRVVSQSQTQQALTRPARSAQSALTRLTQWIASIYGTCSTQTMEMMWIQYHEKSKETYQQNILFAGTSLAHPATVTDKEEWAQVLLRSTHTLPRVIDRARAFLASSPHVLHPGSKFPFSITADDQWYLRYQCLFRLFLLTCSYLGRYIPLIDYIVRLCLLADSDSELLSGAHLASFKIAQVGEEIFSHAREPSSHIHHLMCPASKSSSSSTNHSSQSPSQRPRSNSFPCISSSSLTCPCLASMPACASLSNSFLLHTLELSQIQALLAASNQRQYKEDEDAEEDDAAEYEEEDMDYYDNGGDDDNDQEY
jgi:Zinc-finger of C2H2 type